MVRRERRGVAVTRPAAPTGPYFDKKEERVDYRPVPLFIRKRPENRLFLCSRRSPRLAAERFFQFIDGIQFLPCEKFDLFAHFFSFFEKGYFLRIRTVAEVSVRSGRFEDRVAESEFADDGRRPQVRTSR